MKERAGAGFFKTGLSDRRFLAGVTPCKVPPGSRLTLSVAAFTSRFMGQDVPTITDLSFEEALKRLEAIVHRLESGEATLDEAIQLYAEGDELRAQCEKRLSDAQARIEKITLRSDGQLVGAQPFDAE